MSRPAKKTIVARGFFAMLIIAASQMGASVARAEAEQRAAAPDFDIAPFALPNCPPGEIRFEEPRDIQRVAIVFKGAPSDVGLQYLQHHWPQLGPEWAPIERYRFLDRPFYFGWYPLDDHYQLERRHVEPETTSWRNAAVETAAKGTTVMLTFKPLTAEVPEAAKERYEVTFRRTLALRLVVADLSQIESVRVFTASRPTTSRLRVTFDAGSRTPGDTVALSAYNADIESVQARSGVSVKGGTVKLSEAKERSFELAASHMLPSHTYCFDDGHVKFDLADDAFTISLESLRKQGPIWFPEAGAFITLADDPTTFTEYRKRHEDERTISEMVADHEEQSFARARAEQPRNSLDRVSYCFGVKYARQGFRLQAYGDLLLDPFNVERKGEARDTERFKNAATSKVEMSAARYFFGLDRWYISASYVDPAPIPAYNIRASKGDVLVEQKTFAVPLLQSTLDGELPRSDDPVVALLRFRFTNTGRAPARAELPIRYSPNAARDDRREDTPLYQGRPDVVRGELDPLRVEKNRILGEYQSQPVLRCSYESEMKPEAIEGGLQFAKIIQPGESTQLLLKVPFIALETAEELRALDGLDFDRSYEEVVRFWQKEAVQGASIVTPVEEINAMFKSHFPHLMVSDYALPDGSGLINMPSGTSTYASPANETAMMTHDLDERGLHEEARRRLGIWLRFQSTARIVGTYTDYDGLLFGAGGFEFASSYNQDHGWILWALAEHYLLTRDDDWLRQTAPKMIAAADWAFRQRRNTMKDFRYSRGWERGWLPAGALEDVDDTFFWLANNALIWRGTEYAARALEAAGHAEAGRIRREADAFKADLIRGFEIQRQHTPLVRLRNGRWVPKYSSRLYLRGRDFGWIREVYEGAMYLLVSGLYDPNSKQGDWILNDYQDNLYPQAPFGYNIENFKDNWFSRAGFNPEPNYFPDVLPYLDRDEPEIFVWMFFNKWASVYVPEIGGMAEHPMPVLGHPNCAIFKTSEESGAVNWLRLMYVYSKDGLLHFGRALPREWLTDGNDIQTSGVATYHGHVGVRYRSEAKSGRITAEVDMDDLREQPRKTLVRFRHPASQPIKSVTVNGDPWDRFDPVKGDVDITGRNGKVTVRASF